MPARFLRLLRPLAVLLVALASISLSGASAHAQSELDLRTENERLMSRIADLERQIAGLREEIARLTQENTQLADQHAAGGAKAPPPPPDEPVVSIDETAPSASPRALLRVLTENYQERAASLEMGESATDPKRIAYLREFERWAAKVNREMKSPVEWHVRIVGDAVAVGRGFTMRLVAVDPVTFVQLGDPFDAYVSRSLARRLQLREPPIERDEVLVMGGTLVPRVHVNEDRDTPGPFDNPRLIGPFAELGFGVEVDRLIPATELVAPLPVEEGK
jgi:uncharacterized small protein (DUF1192 family)